MPNIFRFYDKQKEFYQTALKEIKQGKKESHWMWFIFPQIRGLGSSTMSRYFAIEDLNEAKAFLDDELLGSHLFDISSALLSLKTSDAREIFNRVDSMKLRSSMTLFSLVSEAGSVFEKVLDKYFDGVKDDATLKILEEISEQERKTLMQEKTLQELLASARKIATEAHKGQIDKGGHPYIEHPVAVAAALKKPELKIVALLHDVFEDTAIVPDDLLAWGFPEYLVNLIRILTKSKNESYWDYIKRVKENDAARMVKIEDLKNNSDITRIPNPTERDFKRLERYKKALLYLEGKEDVL